ncbi:MAG: hypothetical protein JW881_19945, partial [Spirochaetales bacterium]|nr:hypothetical protein [Spirochaetales bacterium]
HFSCSFFYLLPSCRQKRAGAGDGVKLTVTIFLRQALLASGQIRTTAGTRVAPPALTQIQRTFLEKLLFLFYTF